MRFDQGLGEILRLFGKCEAFHECLMGFWAGLDEISRVYFGIDEILIPEGEMPKLGGEMPQFW
jgi:hypothetical protein